MGDFAGGGVAVEGGDEDALRGGADDAETEPIKERDAEADEHSCRAVTRPDDGKNQRGQAEQHEDQAEAKAADELFAPGFFEELGGFVKRFDGAHILGGDERHNKEASERPEDADDAGDDAADYAGALLDRAQDHANGGAEQRPLKDTPLAVPRGLEAVIDCGMASGEAIGGDADERDVEKNHDAVGDQVMEKNYGRETLREKFLSGGAVRNASDGNQDERAETENDDGGDQTGKSRDDREPYELLIGFEKSETLAKKIPGAREGAHEGLRNIEGNYAILAGSAVGGNMVRAENEIYFGCAGERGSTLAERRFKGLDDAMREGSHWRRLHGVSLTTSAHAKEKGSSEGR